MSNIEFDIRYSTFDLNVGFSLIYQTKFNIRFECWISSLIFDIRHSNLNVGFSLIYQTKFDIRFECWI